MPGPYRVEALARMPESLEAAEAAPLMWARNYHRPVATAVRSGVILSPFSRSAGLATWACSLPRSSAVESRRRAAA